jgi:quercetin 2,3-dioxygenase
VLKGSLAQYDSMGRSGVIQTGEFQTRIGGSIRCSEMNASQTVGVHIIRMALYPFIAELDSGCEQKLFSRAERRGHLRIVISPDGRKGSLSIHQDAMIYSTMLDIGQHLVHELQQGRIAWLQVVRGEISIGDLILATGDGIGITIEPFVSLTARAETEILLFDLNRKPKYSTIVEAKCSAFAELKSSATKNRSINNGGVQ